MNQTIKTDFCIIGNGTIGMSLAIKLLKQGKSVRVLGPAARPWCASAAAGAMNGCFAEVTPTLLATKEGRAKLKMDHQANQIWDSWLAELCDGDSLNAEDIRSNAGSMVFLNAIGTAEVDSDSFAAIEQALNEYDEPYEKVKPKDLDWIKPIATARPFDALYIPNEKYLNTPKLLTVLERCIQRGGGSFENEMVSGMIKTGSDWQIECVSGQQFQAEQIVVAAGAKSWDIINENVPEAVQGVPPMVSGYGVSALLQTQDGALPKYMLRTPNRAFACGLHCIPREDGLLYLGATNILNRHPQTHAAISDLNFLLDCGVNQLHLDLSEARAIDVQVGNRPIPVDGFPLLGKTQVESLWLASGTYRDGLHQSPLIADYLAELILNDKFIYELSEFTPVRSPINELNREQIVQGAIDHMMATGYEHNWDVPAEWVPRMYRQLRKQYTDTANSVHGTYTPPSEFIAAMNPEIKPLLDAYYKQYS